MKGTEILTTARAAEIFDEMNSLRREFCAETDFIRMDKVWEELCPLEGTWRIRPFRSGETEDYKRKASVIQFGHDLILRLDEKLLENAGLGCMFSNFILAHEFAHLALNHHARRLGVKHFQLFAGPSGMSNLPPTKEEAEANLAAAFFQCGAAILDPKWEPLRLAKRAFSDVNTVKKAQRIAHLEVFQRELVRRKVETARNSLHKRVVL